MNLIEFAQRMPKAELHVHLEGSILPATLLLLAQRNGIELPYKTVEDLQEFYRFRDFAHFIDTYWAITGCLRTPEDYTLIAYDFGCECARQNIRYAEVTFSMSTNVSKTGLPCKGMCRVWSSLAVGIRHRTQPAGYAGVSYPNCPGSPLNGSRCLRIGRQ